LDESRVILSLPSRFGRTGDGGDRYRVFRRRSSKKNGGLFLKRICARQTVCIRRLSDNRAEKEKLRRFLKNKKVTVGRMLARQRARIAEHVRDRHILAIQDTSEINYEAKRGRKCGLGTVGNGTDAGLFVHPLLMVDAETGHCLGLADVQVWRRFKKKDKNYKRQPIEAKESYRWVRGPHRASWGLSTAAMVTVIDDREGDIYEKWARLPKHGFHLLSRACRDRAIAGGGTLFATMSAFPEQHRFTLDLPSRPGKRQARKARLSVRFGKVRIRRPKSCSDPHAPPEIELSAIEVSEIDPPSGEEPITWRLLSTHDVRTVKQALRLIGWYRWRWHIEQLFRTMKRQGLNIEDSSIVEGDALEKLVVIALIAACRTMQLVLARASPHDTQPASHVFDDRELQVLDALQTRLQGRTEKQQNPYQHGTLAWAAWSVARLGGWTGYESDKSTGPITMRDGLERFRAIVQGYFLYEEDLCSS
jgi:hypothetical protein